LITRRLSRLKTKLNIKKKSCTTWQERKIIGVSGVSLYKPIKQTYILLEAKLSETIQMKILSLI